MGHADTSRPVWHGSRTLEQLHALTRGTLVEHLGVGFCSIGENFLRARWPARPQSVQRLGFLHGKASRALVERVGSLFSQMGIAPGFVSLGLEINANHVRTVKQGRIVEATSSPILLGRQTYIWSARVEDEEGKLGCVTRLTTAVQPRKS